MALGSYSSLTSTRQQHCCNSISLKNKSDRFEDFPAGAVDRNLPVSAQGMGSVLSLGRFHMLQSN